MKPRRRTSGRLEVVSSEARIAQRFERLLDSYRRPDGRRWGGKDLQEATKGIITKPYVTHLRKGRIQNPGYEKLKAIAEAMGFPPELWFEDANESLVDVSGVRPSWLVDRDDNLTLLDEEVAAALKDETARAVLREVMQLPERERRIVLGIVRQFGETSEYNWRGPR
jgi:transcriptional regulator with XRE-family HTH domain